MCRGHSADADLSQAIKQDDAGHTLLSSSSVRLAPSVRNLKNPDHAAPGLRLRMPTSRTSRWVPLDLKPLAILDARKLADVLEAMAACPMAETVRAGLVIAVIGFNGKASACDLVPHKQTSGRGMFR
eukprot:2069339-Amphidinium_carterae.1